MLSYSLSDPEVITVWEKSLEREIRASDPLLDPASGLIGKSPNALIIEDDELNTTPGGTIRRKIKYQLQSRGRAGSEKLKGHEDHYETATFDVTLNTIRNAAGISEPIQQQWISENAMDESRDSLADWAATRLGFTAHVHAAGIPITDEAYRLHNAVAAINSSYLLRPNDKAAGALLESDRFDLPLLIRAQQKVKMLRPKIRPATTPWGQCYVVFISPEQSAALQQDDSVWYAQMTAALQGGNMKSGVWTRALGKYKDFLIMESDHVPPGLNSGETKLKANTRRAWVGGAGALTMIFGRGWRVAPGYAPNRWQWTRESEDYNQSNAVAVTSIVGVKRPRFTRPSEASARENGVLVIETYADLDGIDSADAYKPWTDAGLTIEA